MTGELDDMFNAELNNLVPGIWTKDGIGYPCLKPLNSWFEDKQGWTAPNDLVVW